MVARVEVPVTTKLSVVVELVITDDDASNWPVSVIVFVADL